MEIHPKGIFISIWHLHVQIKNHKENTRTKRETSEAYSEPCQTSKMKIFVKKISAIVYIVQPLYTEVYSEPSQKSTMKLFAKRVIDFSH